MIASAEYTHRFEALEKVDHRVKHTVPQPFTQVPCSMTSHVCMITQGVTRSGEKSGN